MFALLKKIKIKQKRWKESDLTSQNKPLTKKEKEFKKEMQEDFKSLI